jgi:predicted metal-binding protein
MASAPAWAKTETVKGQIVDQNCYLKDKTANKGVDHKMPADTKDCAIECAKKGQPLALLTADGKVYTIYGGLAANNNAKLVPHVGHTVEITGDTMDMGNSLMITADAVKMAAK